MEAFIEELDTLDSRQFVIALRKLATALAYGIDRSPFVGSGIEFAQSRPYQAGDPVRAMDWRVTARLRRFFVKEYETPKSMPCYLLIDTSASMAVSSTARSKYQTALFVAGGIALACLDRISPVGVIGVGERHLRVQPSLSRARVLQWVLELRRHRFDEHTHIGRRLAELLPSLTHRALLVVLSDLQDPRALAALRRAAQLHDCVALRIVDPAESGLAGAGFLRAREAETGRAFVTRGKWGRRRPATDGVPARELRRSGIDHLELATDRPFVPQLRQLFENRGWTGRGAR